MSWRQDFYDRQDRRTRRFFIIFPLMTVLILVLNIWHDMSAGRPFDFRNLAYAGVMLIGAGFLFVINRLVIKFVRALSQRLGLK